MADEEKKEAAEAPVAAPEGESKKSPFVVLLLIVNMIGLGAVAYFQYTFIKKESERPSLEEMVKQQMGQQTEDGKNDEKAKVEKPEGIIMPLETFTVNLAQGDGPRRFVRLDPVLKFSDDSKEAEFTARKPQIRDTIISILNAKRPEDLLKREGKAYLKEEIKSAINSFLIDGQVVDVYYVSFQIN